MSADTKAAIERDLAASTRNEAEELFTHRDCIPGECSQAPRKRGQHE